MIPIDPELAVHHDHIHSVKAVHETVLSSTYSCFNVIELVKQLTIL